MPKVGMGPIRTAQVTAAARHCIAERGFDGTTTRHMAAAAGVSTGTIHHYFASKEEALLAALLDVAQEWERSLQHIIATTPDPWQRLRAIVERNVPSTTQMVQNWRVWLEFWAQTTRRLKLKRVHERIYRQWRQAIVEIIQQGVAAGQFKPCDPDEVASTLVALVDGAGVECILADPGMPPEKMQRLCLSYLRTALGIEADTTTAMPSSDAARSSS